MSGFSLADHGAIDGHTMWGDIFNLQADHIAAAQLAVDGQIEHGQISGALLHLKLGPDRPDVLSGGFEPINFPLFHGIWRGFPDFFDGSCACSFPLFVEGISMGRFQPAATSGPLSARSGLYRPPYQRQEVGI